MNDINPFRKLTSNISSTEFEIYCLEVLKCYAEQQNLRNYTLKHNQKMEAYDSTYQIDVYLEFEIMGMSYKTLCECKRHKTNIKRKDVNDLDGKMKSLGCQKGIIMSTSGFQPDAVKFAKAHGIALWQIADMSIKRITNSISINMDRLIYENEVYKILPKYFVLEWDLQDDYPYREIYPSEEMNKTAHNTVMKILKNHT